MRFVDRQLPSMTSAIRDWRDWIVTEVLLTISFSIVWFLS